MRKNNLPNIRIDALLSQLTGLKVGDEIPTSQVISLFWQYVKAQDLKVKKV